MSCENFKLWNKCWYFLQLTIFSGTKGHPVKADTCGSKANLCFIAVCVIFQVIFRILNSHPPGLISSRQTFRHNTSSSKSGSVAHHLDHRLLLDRQIGNRDSRQPNTNQESALGKSCHRQQKKRKILGRSISAPTTPDLTNRHSGFSG